MNDWALPRSEPPLEAQFSIKASTASEDTSSSDTSEREALERKSSEPESFEGAWSIEGIGQTGPMGKGRGDGKRFSSKITRDADKFLTG
jgi:hypothetical protein